jgi:hypothetical protein
LLPVRFDLRGQASGLLRVGKRGVAVASGGVGEGEVNE